MQAQYVNLDESDPKYALDRLEPSGDASLRLWAKHLQIYQAWAKFWTPRLEVGKKCMNFMRRDIFPEEIRQQYMAVDKYPIEPQVMRPVINTLAGHIGQLVKPCSVTMEDATPPPNAAPPEAINLVLKWMQNRLNIDRKQKKALQQGLITGYPQWVIFDLISSAQGVGVTPDLRATVLPWDAVLCDPTFMEDDGSDMTDLMVLHRMTRQELLAQWPDREKAFLEWENWAKTNPDQMQLAMEGLTADDRSRVFFDMQIAATLGDRDGLYTVVEHIFTIRKKTRVWIDAEGNDVRQQPEGWSDIRWQQWLEQNPQYRTSAVIDTPVLWSTIFGAGGFIWDNSPHWFQEEHPEIPGTCLLPAAAYIADIVDGIPMGAGEDLLPLIVQKAVCETEGLSEVRKGTRTTTYYEQGTVVNPAALPRELAAENGVVALKKGTNPSNIRVETRQVNTAFHELDSRLDEKLMQTHAVSAAMMGTHESRQSGTAKRIEIDASLKPHAPYVENASLFAKQLAQLICYMLPYVLTEEKLITIDDEFGGKQKPVVVNQQEYDPMGNLVVVANDLTSAKFRVVIVPGDDSPTNRMREVQMFTELLSALGNSILKMEPKFIANFFNSLPLRLAKEAGQFMLENADRIEQGQAAQAQAEQALGEQKQRDRKELETLKVLAPKVMLKLGPAELQQAPDGFKFFAQYVDAMQRQAQEAGAAQQAPAQAPAQGGGALAGFINQTPDPAPLSADQLEPLQALPG